MAALPLRTLESAALIRGRILEPPPKARGNERGCVRSTSRSGTARPPVLGSFGDFGHPHLLRLVLRTQPRSGGGIKMRRVNYPTCFGACPANGRMVLNVAFHGQEFPTLPSDDGHASDAPLSGAVAHTFRGRVTPVCGRAGTLDRSDPDERLGSRIGGASCGGVPGTAGSGERIPQPEPGGGQPVSPAGCQLRTDGPRET